MEQCLERRTLRPQLLYLDERAYAAAVNDAGTVTEPFGVFEQVGIQEYCPALYDILFKPVTYFSLH